MGPATWGTLAGHLPRRRLVWAFGLGLAAVALLPLLLVMQVTATSAALTSFWPVESRALESRSPAASRAAPSRCPAAALAASAACAPRAKTASQPFRHRG